MGVNEFSTKALIGDTIFTSPTGDGTATESREGLAICRVKAVPSFLSHFKTLSVGSVREFNPRLTALPSSAPQTELIQPQINFSYFLENPAFMYRLNAVALVMAVGLTIGKHSQALNRRLGNTYLHLLGIEADGGGLGKTLAISDT